MKTLRSQFQTFSLRRARWALVTDSLIHPRALIGGCLLVVALLGWPVSLHASERLRVLIVDGRNNHDWQRTTRWLRDTLEATGRFEVTVTTTPAAFPEPAPRRAAQATPAEQQAFEQAAAHWATRNSAYEASLSASWNAWRPEFEKYSVIVNNYNGLDWPADRRSELVKFVRQGGGLVNVHAADGAFTDWADFDEMIGIGWRDATHGPRVVFDGSTGAMVKLPEETGEAVGTRPGHGRVHEFLVVDRAPDHPILQGLPSVWRHGSDELYHGQRGPAKNFTILATAWSDPKSGGTGRDEPVLWVVNYGAGKVVTTSLGHIWPGTKSEDALKCVGFQTIFTRSVEWAATGRVTLPLPAAFPTEKQVSLHEPLPAASH